MKASYQRELPRELRGNVKGFLYVHKFDLYIRTGIVKVNAFEIILEQGTLDLSSVRLVKYDRPSNIIAKFNWCYAVFNEYDDMLAWLADPAE
jgi:hypothetical protein